MNNGTENRYEIIIVGGGPIGLACGLEAQKADLSYCIIEKGCLVNSLFNYPLNMTFFSTSEKLEIGGIPFVSINNKPRRPEALEYYRRVAMSNNLNIRLQEEVKTITPLNDEYKIVTARQTYIARYVIIATGFYDIPVKMNIPGEDLPKVTHYYKDPHFYAMTKVVVVGASNSAIDAALETFRKGADVTLVVRGPDIGKRVKYWVRPDMENRIKEGSVKPYFNSTLTAIREKEVDIETPEGKITIDNDYVIAMTGYQPNCEFLSTVGIDLSQDEKQQPSYNPETMETNRPNIFLAGVICGGLETHVWFIENSREHAVLIIRAILTKKSGSAENSAASPSLRGAVG
jgi:thioredoxin reductase (NADPH)